LSEASLFTEALCTELAQLPRPHPSFLVSLLTREEPAIAVFREQVSEWWSHLGEGARAPFGARLTSLENDEFFQAFGELAVHEILRYHGIRVHRYANEPGGWMTAASGGGAGVEFGLGVLSDLPDVQVRGSMSVFRHLIRELNQIQHHYYFSVYLKRWLPYDFDPRPIKRALESWLASLDEGSWHGKYAEYRDDDIHLEFSILDKLREEKRDLVRFRISPLRTPEVLDRIKGCVDRLMEGAKAEGMSGMPLVATVFSNEDWALPEMFTLDYFYGKPDYAFYWSTKGGRRERVRTVQQATSKYGVFSSDKYRDLSAIVMTDKEWDRDKVVFSLRVLHNPWASNPLPRGCFGDFAQYCTIQQDGTESYLAWDNPERVRFRLL
jgi:hypothetical protein